MGFQEGFRIPFEGVRESRNSKNLKSIFGLEEVVKQKIEKEIKEGRVAGPFSEPPLPNLRISPLGIVPKKVPGEYRLIHHLSYPHGDSVNDGIRDELASVHYASFDDAVAMVASCGKSALMGKCDIKSAFRLLPIHPDDFNLLGFSFQGSIYVDMALPMGCSISCAAFEKFSTFLEWVFCQRANTRNVVHYLDDFLFAGRQGTGQCQFYMNTFHDLAAELGVPLAVEKTEGPVAELSFLGIRIDTVRELCELPRDKVQELTRLVRQACGRRSLTLREWQVLLGHLNFACRVIAPGRAFTRRLCDSLRGVTSPHHRIRVTGKIKADLCMWQNFLIDFNGISFWRQTRLLEASLQISSDASGSVGFGVYFQGRWCAQRWPSSWFESGLTRDLTFLEFFPLVVAVNLWPADLQNQVVKFWCDNQAVVQVVNKLTSRSHMVMRLVRAFVLQCLRFNILFVAEHIPGVQNNIADALSRFQEQRFRELAPRAHRDPEAMPEDLWSLGERKPSVPLRLH